MMVKGHVMVSTSVYLVAQDYNQETIQITFPLLLNYLFVIIGTLLPDIDYPHSYIGRRFKLIAYPIYAVFGHRRLTHSALFVFSILYASYHFQLPWLLWIGIGAALHILGDYLTNSGVPIFYPISRNYRFIVTIPTNSAAENLFTLALLASSVVFVFFS